MKKIGWTLAVVAIVFVIALIGGSFYMLDYSLAPDPNRRRGLTACEVSVLCATRS